MQVPKSSRGCSSSRPEIQDTDTAANMAASVLPQVSRAPGLSRPANPSWLSTYNITRQEETKPVLAIVKQDGFKIEKPGSVPPIPDRLTRYQTNMTQISRFYNNNEFDKAQKTATVLIGLLSNEPETGDLVRYLNTVIFFCHIMQDMPSCLHLPAKHSGEFIDLLMDIADAASKDTADLPASSKLMLYCWRWAADAGGQDARQSLVKALLFRQLCPDMPLPHVHFFPAEASRHLSDMARDDIPLPEPEDHQETAIHKMVELIRLRNTVNFEREKEELVAFFREQPQPEIRLLIPFIYTSDIFGPPEYDKARGYLEQPIALSERRQVNPFIGDIYRFWELICTSACDDLTLGTLDAIERLAQKKMLAAIHLLSELSRKYTNMPCLYVIAFIKSPGPYFSEYPRLMESLCNFYFEKKDSDATRVQVLHEQHMQEMRCNVNKFLLDTRIQGDPATRDCITHAELSLAFMTSIPKKAGKKFSTALPEITIQMLHHSQYTQDPAALVYIHYAQVLRCGQGDEKLITIAEQKDAFSTYFHMLAISDATTTMDTIAIVNKLLDIPHIKVQDFLVWMDHPGMTEFITNLYSCSVLCRRPEQCLLLCLDLLNIMDKLKIRGSYESKVLTALGLEKTLQDSPDEANRYYKQAWELQDPSQRSARPWCTDRNGYQIRRSNLPEYYQQLSSIQTRSYHPEETLHRYNQILSVWEQMQENKDPSLWEAWIITTHDLIALSPWYITHEMCQKLIVNCAFAIEKRHDLSVDLLLNASRQLLSMVNKAINMNMAEEISHSKELKQIRASLSNMEQAICNQYSPRPEAYSSDEMAKLPDLHLWSTHITQHHVISRIRAATSIDDIIPHIKKLTIENEFDSTTLIRLLAPWFESSLSGYGDDIFSMLLLLHEKLDEQFKSLVKHKVESECKLMLVTHSYCYKFIGTLDQTMKDIVETMEKQKTALFTRESGVVVPFIASRFNNPGDISLPCWEMLSDISTTGFNCLLIKIIELYHPGVVMKLLCKLFTREQCIAKLEQLHRENSNFSYLFKFLIHQINGKKEKMLEFLKEKIKNRTLHDEQKLSLLWYACESPLLTDNALIKQAANSLKHLPCYDLIDILTWNEDDKNIDHLKELLSSTYIMSLDERHWDRIGFKLFSLARLDDAVDMWSRCSSSYPLAMLSWHHGIQPRTQTVDVEQQLLAIAQCGQPEAQCELVHWLLVQRKEGKTNNSLLEYHSRRLVHLSNPIAGGESVLYQGITQHLGFGWEPDPVAGKQKIQEALDKDPLVVALRLYDLKKQGLFVLSDDPTDYLLHYAQALSERDHGPFNRRDSYFNNLLLSYGRDKLQELSVSLCNRAGADASAQSVYRIAADRLSTWLDQWWQGAAPSANASSETANAIAHPASVPQETPEEAAASSTSASRKKSRAIASSSSASRKKSSASRKKSRAIASSTKAPSETRAVTTCTKDDVEQVLNIAAKNNWQADAFREMDDLTRKLRSGEKTGLDIETRKALCILLSAIPLTSRKLAGYADAIIVHISQTDMIADIVTEWLKKLYCETSPEKQVFLMERILNALPLEAPPLAITIETRGDAGNRGNVANREEILCFLELLIQYHPIPESVRYLWDALSAEDRAHLLLQGLPEGIDKNPMMYQQHVETVQPPDPVLVDEIWRALRPTSDAGLIRDTLAALITQNSSELRVIKADDGRLKGINLYTLFAGCNTAQRKTMLGCRSILDGGLIRSLIEKRRRNPGKSVPVKHLLNTIEDVVHNERKKKSMKERDLLDLLISAQDNSSDIRACSSKIKAMVAETLKESIDSSEQQDVRLTALAILFLIS